MHAAVLTGGIGCEPNVVPSSYMPDDDPQGSLDARQWARVRDILHHALELPSAERPAYLDQACGSDRACRDEVESLLAAAGQSAFFDRPAMQSGASAAAPGPATEAMPSIVEGRTLGPYRVLEKLGEGGMGAVYRAFDTRLERHVALKVLNSAHGWVQERRFAREAKAASALNHPNIVTIYEFSRQDGVDYIAMEYVQGTGLDRLVAGHSLPLATGLDYARQIAGALAKAHAAGIVHRDLKPGNIMVTADGVVKVLDFGLAKRQKSEGDDGDTTLTQALTQPGTTVGTPAYMSPEQVLGEAEDWRSDIFSFGVILYEIVCGQRPFGAKNSHQTMYRIAYEEPPAVPEVNPDAPAELAGLIEKCLRKQKKERPQQMAEVEQELVGTLRSLTLAAPNEVQVSNDARFGAATVRERRLALAAVGALAIGTGVWFSTHRSAPPPPAFEYSIEAQKMRNGQLLGEPYTASASDTFEGGDRFRLHMRPSQAGSLYLVTEGPDENGANRLWILYPRPGAAASVTAGQDVETGWYDFDFNPGTEKLWIAWSASPVEKIEKELSSTSKGRVESLDTSHAIEQLLAGLKQGQREPAANGWVRVNSGGHGETVIEKLELKHR